MPNTSGRSWRASRRKPDVFACYTSASRLDARLRSLSEVDAYLLTDAERRLAGRFWARVGDLDHRLQHAGLVRNQAVAAAALAQKRVADPLHRSLVCDLRIGVVEDGDFLTDLVLADAVGEIGLDLGTHDPRSGGDQNDGRRPRADAEHVAGAEVHALDSTRHLRADRAQVDR